MIDLMGGMAVRAVAGRREEYRPVRSRLSEAGDPLRIAAGYRERYGIRDLYVADLDAILGGPRNEAVLRELVGEGFRVAADGGVRCAADAAQVADLGVEAVVAGLETLPGPETLAEVVDGIGRARVVFSLDLADGVPLARAAAWGESTWDADSPLRLARRAMALGVGRLIVLDLRAVGTGGGPATADLCRRIREEVPAVRIWTGGGVRCAADVAALLAAGAEGVLVASALHDGTL